MDTFKAPQEISESDRYKQKFSGRAAPKQSDFLRKRLQGKGGGKYFDSGDYNMAKSKKDPAVLTGKAIPTPEAIPHRKPSCSQSNLLGQPADGSTAAVEDQPLPPSDESMEK